MTLIKEISNDAKSKRILTFSKVLKGIKAILSLHRLRITEKPNSVSVITLFLLWLLKYIVCWLTDCLPQIYTKTPLRP